LDLDRAEMGRPSAAVPARAVGQAVAAFLDQLIARHFARAESRGHAAEYLRNLLVTAHGRRLRKLTRRPSQAARDGLQWLLTGASWDAERLRDDLRGYVHDQFHDPYAALVVGDTGFGKKGDKSAGVALQFNSQTGRIENCQVAVFLAYAGQRGRALIDRELYLPRPWLESAERRRSVGVPDSAEYRSRTVLACDMIRRACRSGVRFRWLVGGRDYGADPLLRDFCVEERIPYVLEVPADAPIALADGTAVVPQRVVAAMHEYAFERRPGGSGDGVPPWEWAATDLPGGDRELQPVLLVGRPVDARDKLSFFLCRTPASTTLGELIHAAGLRTAVAESVAEARERAGLDHYEVRKYVAWYRHMTLAMLANAMLAVGRASRQGAVWGPGWEAGPLAAPPPAVPASGRFSANAASVNAHYS